MLFNSFTFILFFFITYILYLLFKKNLKSQNILILISSYVFYGYWDWRFLFLIALSTVIDFSIGKKLGKTILQNKRKQLLAISVIANLSILGFFKYFNFFAQSTTELLQIFGFNADSVTLNIILPVGISFYTFQTMSYTIDVYRKKLKPTTNFLNFAVFVSFFPQLVAGPIERAVNLLPQVAAKRIISKEMINAGIFLILWGFFKKVVIADNCAIISNSVFNNYESFQNIDLLIGVLAFTFQIYGDFSGYSDIARGISKMLGFELMVNFRLPYFAISPSDFWNRWHISLSSWLRDYLYFPLGGNRSGNYKTYRNLLLTMLLGGLWHGAAWNFVIWGAFHGIILIMYRLFEKQQPQTSIQPNNNLTKVPLIGIMFILTIFGWLIFRANSVDQIWYFISNFSFQSTSTSGNLWFNLLFFISPLIIVQIFQHIKKDLLVVLKMPTIFIAVLYAFLLIWITVFGARESTEFIYFQF